VRDRRSVSELGFYGRVLDVVAAAVLATGTVAATRPPTDAGSGLFAEGVLLVGAPLLLGGAALGRIGRDRLAPWFVAAPIAMCAVIVAVAWARVRDVRDADEYRLYRGIEFTILEEKIGPSPRSDVWDPVAESDGGIPARPANSASVDDRFDADPRGAPVFRYRGMDVFVGYDGRIVRIEATDHTR